MYNKNTELQDNLKRGTMTSINSKITKILNPEENSKRKAHNQMSKSRAQTHQTKG